MIRLFALFVMALAAAEAYTIDGQLVHGGTGAALGKGRVSLALPDSTQPLFTVSTGPNGQFRFDNLKAGKYSLTAERLGFARQAYMQRALYQQYSTAIVVGETDPAVHVVFRMIPGAVISGVVRDTRAEPVPWLEVRAYRVAGSGNQRYAQAVGMASTDDRGHYRIASLAAGAYVLAIGPGAWRHAEALDLEDLAYPVTFYPSAADSGRADLIRVKAGEETAANVIVQPAPAVRVEGAIPPGESTGTLTVNVRARGPFGSEFYVGGAIPVSGRRFTSERIPIGEYVFTLWEGSTKLLAYETLKLAAATSNVALGDVPLARVSVKVEMLGVARSPARQAMVGIGRVEGGWADSRILGVDGRVEFPAVPAGRYEVVVRQGGQLAVVSLAARGARQSAGLIDIPESGSVELAITEDSSATDLNGRVFRGDRPEAGVLVMLIPRTGWENSSTFRFDQSDSDGTFAFRGVSGGDFLMFAFDEGEPVDYIDPETIRGLLPKAQAVTVTGLPNQTVRLTIPAE